MNSQYFCKVRNQFSLVLAFVDVNWTARLAYLFDVFHIFNDYNTSCKKDSMLLHGR